MSMQHDTQQPEQSAAPGAAGSLQPRRRLRGHGRQEHHHAHQADASAIRFAFALAVISVISVAYLQWFGKPADPEPLTPVIHERMLSVADFPGGVVELRDAGDGELLARYDIGEGAFVRTTLRSLADARHRVKPGDESPFRLELRESGRLRLIEPITGQALELWAFGYDNALAFREFLPEDIDPQRALDGAPTVAQEATRSNSP